MPINICIEEFSGYHVYFYLQIIRCWWSTNRKEKMDTLFSRSDSYHILCSIKLLWLKTSWRWHNSKYTLFPWTHLFHWAHFNWLVSLNSFQVLSCVKQCLRWKWYSCLLLRNLNRTTPTFKIKIYFSYGDLLSNKEIYRLST